ELRFQKPPVDRPRQLHQRVVHVDDLIKPRAEQILLAGLPSLAWSHRKSPLYQPEREESRLAIRGNPRNNLQGNRPPMAKNRQIRLLERAQSSSPFNSVRILHERLNCSESAPCRHGEAPAACRRTLDLGDAFANTEGSASSLVFEGKRDTRAECGALRVRAATPLPTIPTRPATSTKIYLRRPRLRWQTLRARRFAWAMSLS